MANDNPNTPVTGELDPKTTEAAFGKIQGQLRELPQRSVTPPNSDLQDAAIAALALVDITREPMRAARFAALPAEVFPPNTVNDLETAALAGWYVQTKVLSEGAGGGGPKVDSALYEDSGKHLKGLLKLIEYHVGDVAEVATELADIQSGIGYQDRASDLTRAASLFEIWQDELRADQRRYDPNAGQLARGYANDILTALRTSVHASAEWADLRNRAWTHLSALYSEVEKTGAWVFRADPEHSALFVPLRRMVTRVRPRRTTSSSTTQTAQQPAEPSASPSAP
jgi:hypothetical protein